MSMTCEELRDACTLYVLGTLEEPERSELTTHLTQHCPSCSAEVARAQALVTSMAMTAPPAAPPAHLKAHVMRAVVRSTGRNLSFWESTFWRMAFPVTGIAALALLLVTIGMFGEIHSLNSELDTLQKTTAAQRIHEQEANRRLAAYREALAMMTAKESREVKFGPKQPEGRVFVNPKGLLMIAWNLPLPSTGRTYELWLLRANSTVPQPAGTFDPDQKGLAMHMFRQDIDVKDLKAIAVSDEPAGGLSAPSTKPFLVVSVAGMSR